VNRPSVSNTLKFENGVDRRVHETVRAKGHDLSTVASKAVVLESGAEVAQGDAAATAQDDRGMLTTVMTVRSFLYHKCHLSKIARWVILR